MDDDKVGDGEGAVVEAGAMVGVVEVVRVAVVAVTAGEEEMEEEEEVEEEVVAAAGAVGEGAGERQWALAVPV